MAGHPRIRLRTQSATKTTPETLQQADPRCRHADPVPLAMLCSGQELQFLGHLADLLNGHQQCHGVFAALRLVQQQQHAPIQGETVFHNSSCTCLSLFFTHVRASSGTPSHVAQLFKKIHQI